MSKKARRASCPREPYRGTHKKAASNRQSSHTLLPRTTRRARELTLPKVSKTLQLYTNPRQPLPIRKSRSLLFNLRDPLLRTYRTKTSPRYRTLNQTTSTTNTPHSLRPTYSHSRPNRARDQNERIANMWVSQGKNVLRTSRVRENRGR